MILSKKRNRDVNELERKLMSTEPDKNLINTVLEGYKISKDISKKCTNPFHPIYYRNEKGLILYIGHDENSSLSINGKLAKYVDGGYYLSERKGKKFVRRLVGEDGAIEIFAHNNRINSYRRMFQALPNEVAVEKGMIKEGEDISPADLGFIDDDHGFMRQLYAISATGRDPGMYVITVSGKTGDIRVMHDYDIISSTIPSEIHSDYSKLLHMDSNKTKYTPLNHNPVTL